jgi:hypothetical protein
VRYHVFIEGSRDATPAGIEILASTLGRRYGMSPPAVVRQLKDGRFCARASLDLPAAQRLVVELESLGAHASLVGDGAPTPLGPRYESGLAAAFDRQGVDGVSLGALDPDERTDSGWQLTSVDGADMESAPTIARPPPAGSTTLPGWTAVAPPRGGPPPVPVVTQRSAPVTPGPAPAPAPVVTQRSAPVTPGPAPSGPPPPIFSAPSPALAPMLAADAALSGRDPFQPPDAPSKELLELADMPTRVLAMTPRPPPSRTEPPQGVVAGATYRRPSLATSLGDGLADSPRARFAAGLALAFIVGLLPAFGFAWSRSDSAYDDIRAQLQADYAAADTPERWAALSAVREDAVALADARQRRLAISSLLIWLATAGAVAFVWFRVIDWPRGPEPA